MSDKLILPLYYEGQTLSDMEASLRSDYLTQSGWLESADTKLSQRAGQPVPWITYGAIEFLERELTSAQAMFEFGGGHSTLFWAQRLSRVVGVDHDPAFVEHVRLSLPSNADLLLIEEDAPLSQSLESRPLELPRFLDPERTERTYRSGQLNIAFRTYALTLLEQPPGLFDVIVIDGMARVLSTWVAIKYLEHPGLIIFDNSDRDFYQAAYDILEYAGYRRIDFWGLGPVNPYQWCTSIFYKPENFLGTSWFAPHRLPAPTAPSATGLGILILAYNRPFHVQAVLESLRLQGRIGDVHLWIDGTQGRGEYANGNHHTVEIAKRYSIKEVRVQKSHLGIEKLMLDALTEMSNRYDRVLVLEDDCFPIEGAVDAFEAELADISQDQSIYSVYGHHFGFELANFPDFPRFQGWGWAAHSRQIKRLLPGLKALFLMGEAEYLKYVAQRMTSDIRERLDRTPGRDVLNVLQQFFSWDSATAFLAASMNLSHRRTRNCAVINTGIVPGIGHFEEDTPRLRAAPFNMVPLDEAWAHYDQTTRPCDYSQDSYGLDGLDKIIAASIPRDAGFFIEIGAFDGVTQSNSLLLEAAGWRGLLIEANPGNYAKAARSRPNALVEHAACVGFGHAAATTIITDVGLMSMTSESRMDESARTDWLSRGEGFNARARQDIEVPVTTVSALLDKHAIEHVDLLLLDVEGAEVAVLEGIDFDRHAPTRIVAEDAYDECVAEFLQQQGYVRTHVLLERKYTRDCLFVRQR